MLSMGPENPEFTTLPPFNRNTACYLRYAGIQIYSIYRLIRYLQLLYSLDNIMLHQRLKTCELRNARAVSMLTDWFPSVFLKLSCHFLDGKNVYFLQKVFVFKRHLHVYKLEREPEWLPKCLLVIWSNQTPQPIHCALLLPVSFLLPHCTRGSEPKLNKIMTICCPGSTAGERAPC